MILPKSHYANHQNVFKLDILIRLLITVRKIHGLLKVLQQLNSRRLDSCKFTSSPPTVLKAWPQFQHEVPDIPLQYQGLSFPCSTFLGPSPSQYLQIILSTAPSVSIHTLYVPFSYLYSIFLSPYAQHGHFWHESQVKS